MYQRVPLTVFCAKLIPELTLAADVT